MLQYSMVRCEKHVVNNEIRWCIQVNSAKISLLTEVFALNIIQNHLTQDDEIDRRIVLETGRP